MCGLGWVALGAGREDPTAFPIMTNVAQFHHFANLGYHGARRIQLEGLVCWEDGAGRRFILVDVSGALWAPSWKDLQLLAIAPERWVAQPVVPIADFPRHSGLVRLRGTLVSVTANRVLVVEDPTGRTRVLCIRMPSVTVDLSAPADPFALETRTVAGLRSFDPHASAFQRVKGAGQIVHAQPGLYCLMDGANGLRFLPKHPASLPLGALTEILGFPRSGLDSGPKILLLKVGRSFIDQLAIHQGIRGNSNPVPGQIGCCLNHEWRRSWPRDYKTECSSPQRLRRRKDQFGFGG